MEMEEVMMADELGTEFITDEPEGPEGPEGEVELVPVSFECELCGDEFDTEKGLNIHVGRTHK